MSILDSLWEAGHTSEEMILKIRNTNKAMIKREEKSASCSRVF